MGGGDTLIIKDGIYYISLKDPPSGKESQYTIIKAQNDGEAIINSSYLSEWQYALNIYNRRYVQIEGIKFQGGRVDGTGNSAGVIIGCDYVKIERCAFFDPSYRSAEETPGGTNYHTFSMTQCNYMLLEDC